MRSTARGFFAAATLAFAHLIGHAADPIVTFTFDPLNSPASVSRDESAWNSYSGGVLPANVFLAGYSAVITNNSTNTINNFRLTATTSVWGGAPEAVIGSLSAPYVEFYSSRSGVTCSTPVAPTTVQCQLGQFRSGDSVTVTLVFKTPLVLSTTSSLPTKITVAATAAYGEGPNDNLNAAHKDGSTGDATTALTEGTSTAQQLELKTFIPSAGATFYTGKKTVTSASGDLWSTEATVPGLDWFTTANVNENTFAPGATCIGCNPALTTQLSIPADASAPRQQFTCEFNKPETCLRVTLRRDASTITGSVKNAPIYYLPDGGSQYVQLYACSVMWAAPGQPCVWDRTEVKNNDPDIQARRDWVIQVLMAENGRIQM